MIKIFLALSQIGSFIFKANGSDEEIFWSLSSENVGSEIAFRKKISLRFICNNVFKKMRERERESCVFYTNVVLGLYYQD